MEVFTLFANFEASRAKKENRHFIDVASCWIQLLFLLE
jgi:hypothetical protein